MSIVDITYYKHELDKFASILEFYDDEIKALEKRLEEVTRKNYKQEILAQVEHFQNQFILQQETFMVLQHDIRLLQAEVKKFVTHERESLAELLIDNHHLFEKVQTAIKIFTETKHAYYRFLSTVF